MTTRTIAVVAGFVALALGGPAMAGPPQTEWDGVARVVAVGDLHGDYGKFHDQLSQAGLIDARDNWIGGKTHLVQLGDVPDRAPDTRKILDLLIRLEPQARKAGGYVHALIGNHEAMNMEGDLRYTTPGEFAAFVDKDSARKRDAYYALVVQTLKSRPPAGQPPIVFDDAYRAKFDADHPLGWVEHQIAWSADGVYGRWVTTHSAVIRINDTLYLHAGLGPSDAGFSVDTLDKAVVRALKHEPEDKAGPHDVLWAEDGPLWYRGLAQHDEAAEAPNVAAILAAHKVGRIVIGHTKQYSMVNSRFDGRVILTDIAVRGGCIDPHAFLIQEGGALTAVYRGHRLTLRTSGQGHLDYLAEVAALDRQAEGDPALAEKCAVTGVAAAPAEPDAPR